MPKLLISNAFTLLYRVITMLHTLLRRKIFSLKIRECKSFDKYHVWWWIWWIVCLFKNKSRQLAIKRQNRGWGVSEWKWPLLCFCFFLKPPAKTFEFVQGIRFCPMHHRRSLHSGIGKNFCKSWQHTFGFWTAFSKWILTTLWVQGGKIFALVHFQKIIFCCILAWILFLPAIIYVDGKMHVKITITGLKGY